MTSNEIHDMMQLRWKRGLVAALLVMALSMGCHSNSPDDEHVEGGASHSPGTDSDGIDPHRKPAATMSYLGATWLLREERVIEERPDEMLDMLDIRAGMVVADIGAGAGYHSVKLADRVGPDGKVYATDIQPEMIAIAEAATEGYDQVETLLVSQNETGLPDGKIELAIMVDVYHELSEPQLWLRNMSRALAPDGQLVLVEFRADDPDVPIKPEHTMSKAQAVWELEQAGFALVAYHDTLPWQHVLVFEYEGDTR